MRLHILHELIAAAEAICDVDTHQDFLTRLPMRVGRLAGAVLAAKHELAADTVPVTVSTRALAQDRDEDPPDLYNSRRDSPLREDGNPF